MDWSWGTEEDEEPSVDYMEYLARRASCSVLPDPPKAMVSLFARPTCTHTHKQSLLVFPRSTRGILEQQSIWSGFSFCVHRWLRLRCRNGRKVFRVRPTHRRQSSAERRRRFSARRDERKFDAKMKKPNATERILCSISVAHKSRSDQHAFNFPSLSST